MAGTDASSRAGRLRTVVVDGDAERLRLLDCLPHEVGQSEDVVPSVYAILKIVPEGNAQLPTGLLQAEKSIAATAKYIADFDRIRKGSRSPKAIAAAMKKIYPHLALPVILDITAAGAL